MTSVVLVDDQALVRDGLRLILEVAGVDVIGEAGDGALGAALVLERSPDVVLMDLRMPGTDGIEATRRIVASGSATRVVVLTTFQEDDLTRSALAAGASGYLLKDAGGARIVEAVRAAAAGELPLSPAVAARLVESYVRSRPAPSTDRLLAPLSDREREVLALVGAGRSNGEIARELYISLATVKSHLRHILAKLDLRDRASAIVLAHQCGLVTEAPAPP